jgi:hypothetical protein
MNNSRCVICNGELGTGDIDGVCYVCKSGNNFYNQKNELEKDTYDFEKKELLFEQTQLLKKILAELECISRCIRVFRDK